MEHQHFSTRSWLKIKKGEAPHCWHISRTRWLKNLWKSLKEVAQGGPGGNSSNRQVWFFYVNKNKNLQNRKLCDFPKNVFKTHFFSETWALPITVVIAVMAYVALASTFYNMDVWLLNTYINKRTLHVRMYLDDKAIKTCSLNISSFDQSTLHVRMYIDYQRIKILYTY